MYIFFKSKKTWGNSEKQKLPLWKKVIPSKTTEHEHGDLENKNKRLGKRNRKRHTSTIEENNDI